jgi:cell division protein FtsQ
MPRPPAPPRPKFSWKLPLRVAVWMAILAGAVWGGKEVNSFLLRDPRFELNCPEREATCANLELRGAIYTNRARIRSVFAQDFGRSIFQMPLPERRRHLLAIDWVNSASISRVWPDHIAVSITERRPVAFVRLPGVGVRYRLSLIDGAGVLLSIPPKVRFHLPVLAGVTEEQTEAERRIRVDAMRLLLDDLGPQAKDISEINAANTLDLRVVTAIDGHGVELWMGDQHYRARYLRFLNNYPEIRKHSERSAVFDLRLDDRILAR